MRAEKIPYNQYHHPKLANPGRLAALHATGLLGTPPEASFDRFTRLASMLLDTPFTAISLIDRNDVFIKSHFGVLENACNKPVSETFCQHVVDRVEPLVIDDTSLNELVCDNPAVLAGALAYLAIPLVTDGGHTLGTLCAVQDTPRQWSERDILIMTDLAASVMIEIELRQLTNRLLDQYNQLRAAELQRDEMVHMLVHDLRNPLTSLLAGMHLIDDMSPLDPMQKQALDISRRGGDALLTMINEVLDVSKGEAGHLQLQLQDTDLPALMASACEQVSHLAIRSRVRLEQQAPALPTCQLDSDKLRRVLVNLLANAIQHSPDGHVLLSAEALGDGRVALHVSDNGLGIAADRISRVFDKFGSEASRQGASTGLGLAFCKLVVEAHGGSIRVDSELGRGATFTLELPAGTH